MRDALRHFVAELVGTFALVLVAGAALVTADPGVPNGLQPALAYGLVVAALVSATIRVAGHFNPAVTVGFLAARRIEPVMAGVFLVAQLLGATLAAYALEAVLPGTAITATDLGGQRVAPEVGQAGAALVEAFATFLLVLTLFGSAVDRHAPRLGGLPAGLVVVANVLAFGRLSGASMNPARSFGPAVASGDLAGQSVYWIGPLLGGIAGALLYQGLFMRHGIEPVDHGAVQP